MIALLNTAVKKSDIQPNEISKTTMFYNEGKLTTYA